MNLAMLLCTSLIEYRTWPLLFSIQLNALRHQTIIFILMVFWGSDRLLVLVSLVSVFVYL